MPKFHVNVPQVYISTMEVEAEDEDDARDKVVHGEGEEVNLSFSHSILGDDWEVEDAS